MKFETMPLEEQEKKKRKKGLLKKTLRILTAAGLISQAAEAGAINIEKKGDIDSKKSTTMRMTAEELNELQKKPEITKKAFEIHNKTAQEIPVSASQKKSIEEFLGDLTILNPNLKNISANSCGMLLQGDSYPDQKKIFLRVMTEIGTPSAKESLENYLQRAIEEGVKITPDDLEKLAKLARI